MDVKHFKQGHKVCNTLQLEKENYFQIVKLNKMLEWAEETGEI